jgi:hypothetical protein
VSLGLLAKLFLVEIHPLYYKIEETVRLHVMIGTEEELLEIYSQTKVEKSADALTKLLVQYIERFGSTLVNERTLSLNTQSLRYTNARLREWKRKKDSGEGMLVY